MKQLTIKSGHVTFYSKGSAWASVWLNEDLDKENPPTHLVAPNGTLWKVTGVKTGSWVTIDIEPDHQVEPSHFEEGTIWTTLVADDKDAVPPTEEDQDEDGYPTGTCLTKVATWPIVSDKDALELIAYLKNIWAFNDYFTLEQDGDDWTLHASTAGWSGNEELIAAMRSNFPFQAMYWQQTKRGGHYIYSNIDEWKKKKPATT